MVIQQALHCNEYTYTYILLAFTCIYLHHSYLKITLSIAHGFQSFALLIRTCYLRFTCIPCPLSTLVNPQYMLLAFHLHSLPIFNVGLSNIHVTTGFSLAFLTCRQRWCIQRTCYLLFTCIPCPLLTLISPAYMLLAFYLHSFLSRCQHWFIQRTFYFPSSFTMYWSLAMRGCILYKQYRVVTKGPLLSMYVRCRTTEYNIWLTIFHKSKSLVTIASVFKMM